MTDLTKRLRRNGEIAGNAGRACNLYFEAADEIDRLRAVLDDVREETVRLNKATDKQYAQTLERLKAERDAALAQVARLHHLIREASDPDFLWGAMDNVNDMDADITEFANAASRSIRASIPNPDALSRRDAQMRAAIDTKGELDAEIAQLESVRAKKEEAGE